MADAPALPWPAGWPRTPAAKRLRGAFGKGVQRYNNEGKPTYMAKTGLQWNDAVRRAQDEIRRMGGSFPRIDTAAGDDNEPGVVVSFRIGTRPVVFPCDRYTSKAQNLAAIAATLEAKRAIERHGVSTLEREFEGYLALPSGDVAADAAAAATMSPRAMAMPAPLQRPHEVLGVAEDAPLEVVHAAWKAHAKKAHPDVDGGSTARFQQITEARDAMVRARTPP